MTLKFCPNCGTALKLPNPKFCSQCGKKLLSDEPVKAPEIASSVDNSPEEELKPKKLNAYTLGLEFEKTTAAIFVKMGYCVERRKRVPTKSGATAEIDLLLTRGNRRKIVECKNYDPSRSVPISDMRVFKDKMSDTSILSGIFVTNTYFSEDAKKCAESVGIELWDGDIHKEKFYAYSIGRIRNPSLIEDEILPVSIDFLTASSLNLQNSNVVRLFSSVLLYHPYIAIKFRLQAKRNASTGKSFSFSDQGTYFVDALDGDIINAEKDIMKNILGLLKCKEERLTSKENSFVTEDLQNITSVVKPVLSNSDYNVSPAETEITEEEATRIVKQHVIDKNKKEVAYQTKKRGELETRYFSFVPKLKEISIRGVKLIYVPKWNFEYECGQYSFSRRYLASSGRIIEDDLAKCGKCSFLKKETIAVCEKCGIPLCERHAFNEGKFLCEDHISEKLRQEIKSKGVISNIKRKIF
jgi:hypothetical protein